MATTDIILPRITPQEKLKFSLRVEARGKNECWPYRGRTDDDGYGLCCISRNSIRAHRIAYFLDTGNDPAGKLVLHRCDNPPCCNPRHLYAGTQADNMRDKCEKGRQSKGPQHAASRLNPARGDRNGARLHPERMSRGERNGNSKLSEEEVIEIRKRFANGETRSNLAREYRASITWVCSIVARRVWKHI